MWLWLAACDGPCTAPIWFRDADGDGHGDPGEGVCVQADGYVLDATDCDDGNGEIPDEYEWCDSENLDENCDGFADDADSNAKGKPYWYVDADGDGYGVAGEYTRECETPERRATNTDDCDDTDASVYPGADDPYPDGLDHDCDGLDAETNGVDSADWMFEDERGFFVHAISAEVTGDGQADVVVASPNSSWFGTETGAVFVLPGETPGSVTAEDTTASISGVWPEGGFSASTAEVRNPDGTSLLAVGDVWGSIIAFETPLEGERDAESAELWLWSDVLEWATGGVAGVGDVDGDGQGDIASTGQAGAYIVSGAVRGEGELVESAFASLSGMQAGLFELPALLGVDLDGDGVQDVVSAHPTMDESGAVPAVYCLLGPIAGSLTQKDADAVLLPPAEAGRYFGLVTGAQDFDGDGLSELIVGAPAAYGEDAGHVYIYRSRGGAVVGDPGITLVGPTGATFGRLIEPDGAGGLWIASPMGGKEEVDRVYHFPPLSDGSWAPADAADLSLAGEEPLDWFGAGLANADGLLIGTVAGRLYGFPNFDGG